MHLTQQVEREHNKRSVPTTNSFEACLFPSPAQLPSPPSPPPLRQPPVPLLGADVRASPSRPPLPFPLLLFLTRQSLYATSVSQGTPVRPTSILVVGATGTLGRQVVRRMLDEGYDVRCLVRPRPTPSDFLQDWGATIYLSGCLPTKKIRVVLVGQTDASCASQVLCYLQLYERIRMQVDWEGKVALIQCAKAMGIQKYVFYSIHNCDKHPKVLLMEFKHCTEKFLQDSGLNYIIIGLCGFIQDIAWLTFIAMHNEKVDKKLLTFAGPRAWTTEEVITLCERLAGQDANLTTVPVSVLKFTLQLTRFFQWTNDVADRLAFSEVLLSNTVFSAPMTETYNLLGFDQKDIVT